MYDLILNYKNTENIEIQKCYELITDFCDNKNEIKNMNILKNEKITAVFFEKDFHKKNFTSVTELIEYCNKILS